MTNSPEVKEVQTVRRNVIVIFGDTNGFSNFTLRTIDDPTIHRDYLLSLYQRAHQYATEQKCFLKKECDGVMLVHDFEHHATKDETVVVLRAIERFQRDCEKLVKAVPYPRPDGFRCRVTMGMAWKITTVHFKPTDCTSLLCAALSDQDYWEYSTILASRMLDTHRKIPLACCQLVRETVGDSRDIQFSKLAMERRIPDGIFKQDMQDLWSFTGA